MAKKNKTARLPNHVKISALKIGLDKIHKGTFMNMLQRVKAYQKSHNGKMPQLVGVEADVPQPTPPTPPSTPPCL